MKICVPCAKVQGTQLFQKSADNYIMGKDLIMALAREARLNPGHAIANLSVLPPSERAQILKQALAAPHTPYRRYSPNPDEVVLQLIANEYVAPSDERRLKTFYSSQSAAGNLFHLQYLDVWQHADAVGAQAFFSEPRLLTYVLQTVTPPNKITSLLKAVSALGGARQEKLVIPGVGKIPVFVCGAMAMLPSSTSVIVDEMRWMSAQNYALPGAIMVKPEAGGSRQTNREPCAGLPVFKGSHLRVGAVGDRMACTLRHEDMHEVRARLPDHVLQRVEGIYGEAMLADFGLIFNDEFYMKKFLHAGHPMQNSNEFFASAAHAFTHHADALVILIQSPDTPKAVRSYASAMWHLLRDDVFHGKVFTANGKDLFR